VDVEVVDIAALFGKAVSSPSIIRYSPIVTHRKIKNKDFLLLFLKI